MAKLTREELYALVWDRPMTKLAKEFGLSDVALHKVCRKHNVPTPPAGYWAKKAHGKPVTTTPFPNKPSTTGRYHIIIHEGAGSVESEAAADARARVHEAISNQPEHVISQTEDPILQRTIAKLLKAKADKSGLARIEGRDVITVALRPECASRAQQILELLVGSARAAGITLAKGDRGVVWHAEGEEVSFDLAEVADRVEHVPTEAELKAVAKWEAEREAYRKRTGYERDLLPTPLKAFTDTMPEIKAMLRICARNLYRWQCDHESMAEVNAALNEWNDWVSYPESWPREVGSSRPLGVVELTAEIEKQAARRLATIQQELRTAGEFYPREEVLRTLDYWKIPAESS